MTTGDTVIYTREIMLNGEQLKGTRGKVIEVNTEKRLALITPERGPLTETWYLIDAWEVVK